MSTPTRVVVGSRASPLSLAQNDEVLAPLKKLHPETEFAVVPMTTLGDRAKDAPLLSMGRGMFVKEIALALLRGDIDFAVHSAKDVPSEIPEGLTLAAIGERRDPRDALVNRWGVGFDGLPAGARLGTSSPRRTAQLRARRTDIEFLPIRGNVGTRLDKAGGDDYDGVVLAAAGIQRLGRETEIAEYLPTDWCTPDAGQGALAVQARSGDARVLDILTAAHHEASGTVVYAERAFIAAIGGGCTVPVAAYATLEEDRLHISTMAALPDGTELCRAAVTADSTDPESAGRSAAETLLRRGASDIIGRGAPT